MQQSAMRPSPVSVPILESYIRDESQTLFVEHNTTLIQGKLDLGRLEEAFRTVVARHDALRTSYSYDHESGDVRAIVHEECPAQINVHYVKSEDASAKIHECFAEPMPYSRAPLIRMTVVSTDNDTQYMIISACHAIMDGTSSPLFNDELCKAYRGEALEAVEYQYSDFALWQNQLYESQRVLQEMGRSTTSTRGAFSRNLSRRLSQKLSQSLSRTLSQAQGGISAVVSALLKWDSKGHPTKDGHSMAIKYYKKALAKMPERINYPLDFPRPERIETCQANHVIRTLDSSTIEALVEFSATLGHQSTWWTVVMAGIFFMLRVYSGQDDTYMLVPRTCRPSHMQSVIGHFANDAPVRLDPRARADKMNFVALARHIWMELGNAAKHAPNIFGAEIQNACFPNSQYRTLPVQVTFTAIEEEWLEIDLPGVKSEAKPELVALQRAYEDFYIRAVRGKSGWKIIVEYNKSIFLRETVENMATVIVELISEWSQNPKRRLQDLQVYSYLNMHSFWSSFPRRRLACVTTPHPDRNPKVISKSVRSSLSGLRFERTDILLAGIILCDSVIGYEQSWGVSCVTRGPSGPRLHLVNSLVPASDASVEGFISRVRNLRLESYENAIFSYNQQLALAGMSNEAVVCCVVDGEVSANYVLELGVKACLYLDVSNNVTAKYHEHSMGESDVRSIVEGLAMLLEVAARTPSAQLVTAWTQNILVLSRLEQLMSGHMF